MTTQQYVLVGVFSCVRTCVGREGVVHLVLTGEHDGYVLLMLCGSDCYTFDTPLWHPVVFLVRKQTGLV